jgi:hypothetical protein
MINDSNTFRDDKVSQSPFLKGLWDLTWIIHEYREERAETHAELDLQTFHQKYSL